jgi:hypothetical protein
VTATSTVSFSYAASWAVVFAVLSVITVGAFA